MKNAVPEPATGFFFLVRFTSAGSSILSIILGPLSFLNLVLMKFSSSKSETVSSFISTLSSVGGSVTGVSVVWVSFSSTPDFSVALLLVFFLALVLLSCSISFSAFVFFLGLVFWFSFSRSILPNTLTSSFLSSSVKSAFLPLPTAALSLSLSIYLSLSLSLPVYLCLSLYSSSFGL